MLKLDSKSLVNSWRFKKVYESILGLSDLILYEELRSINGIECNLCTAVKDRELSMEMVEPALP